MTKHKPFSRTEMKILIFKKMNSKGMAYEDAVKELNKEIDQIIENDVKEEKKLKRMEEKKTDKQKFDEEFSKLKR